MKKTKSLIFYIIAFLMLILFVFSGINFSCVKTHTFAQDSQTYIQSAQTNDNFYLNMQTDAKKEFIRKMRTKIGIVDDEKKLR